MSRTSFVTGLESRRGLSRLVSSGGIMLAFQAIPRRPSRDLIRLVSSGVR
jgi:hypothetical protein